MDRLATAKVKRTRSNFTGRTSSNSAFSPGRRFSQSPYSRPGETDAFELHESGEGRRIDSKSGYEYIEFPTLSNENSFLGFLELLRGQLFLSSLLLFLPFAVLGQILNWSHPAQFFFNFVSMIPLAWLIGEMTELCAVHVGETAGGLLNATFGNIVEMILAVVGLMNNELAVVKCTLIGSILSNTLLVLGTSLRPEEDSETPI